ncbi:hypothetical protein ZWY2020_018442 [Hordeum vulgare]|nr:hypothetical protein ZWY2020_018442 [Hordeum vulgare]
MASSSSATSGDDRPPAGGGGGGGGTPAQAHAEWAASMHAYYAAAAGHPYAAWPVPPQTQHGLVAAGPGAAYGAPVPFPMYHHPAAAYYAHAHASMAAGVPYMAGESASAAGKRVGKTRRVPSGEINSSSGSGDAGSQGSSEKGDANQKGSSSSAKRRKSGATNTEGEPSQAATVQNAVTEPPVEVKDRCASKLLVLAPGRAALTTPAPNLNSGIDPLSASPSSLGQGEVNAAASSQSNASLSQMDERELKRERRKQSNRESARRSRLRKQQECEELAQKVSELTAANGTLRSELDQLKEDCKTMEVENKQLMGKILGHDDKMQQSEGPSVVTTLSIQVEPSEPHHGGDGKAT